MNTNNYENIISSSSSSIEQIDITPSSSSSLSNEVNTVNGIYLNENQTLLSFATNNGYIIFSYPSFVKLKSSHNNNIGALKIVYPLYQSSLLLLVGKDSTSYIKDNEAVLYNDKTESQLSSITFNNNIHIISAKVTLYYVILALDVHEIKIFDITTLNEVVKVNDVYYSMTFNNNNILLINNSSNTIIYNVCNSNKSNIKINTLSLLNKSDTDVSEDVIHTPFNVVEYINVDKKGKRIIVLSDTNNRIHVYNVKDKKLICCFDVENNSKRISIVALGGKCKFCAVMYINNLIEIYMIHQDSKCKCFNEDNNYNNNYNYDETNTWATSTNRSNPINSSNSNNILTKSFTKYKYKYRYIDELISSRNDTLSKGFILHFKGLSEIHIIDSHGIFQGIKFNSQSSSSLSSSLSKQHQSDAYIWCYKELKFNITSSE